MAPFSRNKIYLTLAETKRWSGEMPIGDPFGGPAFGDRNPPVIALAGAYAGAMTGVGMVAAATSVGSMVMGGMLIAGSALSVIGMVTGNQKLSKIGGVLSLVGGVGAFASGAFSSAADAAASAATDAGGSAFASRLASGASSLSDAYSAGVGKIAGAFGGQASAANAVVPANAPLDAATQAAAPIIDKSAAYAGQAAATLPPAQPGGLLSGIGDFAKSSGGQQVISGAIQGIGSAMQGDAEADAARYSIDKQMELKAAQTARASNGPLMIEANATNRSELEQIAASQGRPVIYVGANQAQPYKPVGLLSQPAAAQPRAA